VALDFVFDSLEGFTRGVSRDFASRQRYSRIRRRIAVMPGRAIDTTVLPQRTDVLKEEKDLNTKQWKPIFVQIIERPARKRFAAR
jgi:hypothetical protein